MDAIQIKDAGNWITAPPGTMPTIAAPFIGKPFPTLERGVLGSTFSVVGTAGKGGTVTFNYAPTTNQTPSSVPVRVPLHIADLGQALLVPLQNVEAYFWLEFAPDDNTLGFVALSCVHQLASPPPLIRFLSQGITDNEAVTNHRVFLSARKSDGTWPPINYGQGLRAVSLPVTLATEDLGVVAKDTTLALRPSQFPGRTHVDRSASAVTATTTLYTVTAGKTFYLTDLVYSFVSVGANAVVQLTDGPTTVKLPLVGAAANSLQGGTISFSEPIPFTTSVVATKALAAAILASFTIVGYEA